MRVRVRVCVQTECRSWASVEREAVAPFISCCQECFDAGAVDGRYQRADGLVVERQVLCGDVSFEVVERAKSPVHTQVCGVHVVLVLLRTGANNGV